MLTDFLKFFQITLFPFYLMLLASCRRSLDSKSPGILLGSGTIPEGAIYIAHNIRHTPWNCALRQLQSERSSPPAWPCPCPGKHLPSESSTLERIFTQDILVSEAKCKKAPVYVINSQKGFSVWKSVK